MLRFEEVTRRYGPTLALDTVTFSLEAGTLNVISGENGAGKSTILRIAATLEAPTTGRATVAGTSGHEARRKLAWLGQEPGLYDELTVAENLAFAASIHEGRPSDAVRDAARAVGIDAKLSERARHLSRGERQRAAIARTLLGGPLLLLDEPTTALDAEGVGRLHDLLVSLRGTRTMLVASHDPELAKRADRLFQLSAGRLHA